MVATIEAAIGKAAPRQAIDWAYAPTPRLRQPSRVAQDFAGSALAGQRAAIVMSLVQSAKLQGHDPWACLNDVLTRLPTQLNSRIDELLPHNWQSPR